MDLSVPINSEDQKLTAVEERAIELLAQSVPPSVVATATGVSPSRISQLLADPLFSEKISNKKYARALKLVEKDDTYDQIEEKLLGKLKENIPMMHKTGDILNAIRIVNGAVRRANGGETMVQPVSQTATITLPQIIHQTLVMNINNQVIQAGNQDLITIQSGNMEKLLESSQLAMKALNAKQSIPRISDSLPRIEGSPQDSGPNSTGTS